MDITTAYNILKQKSEKIEQTINITTLCSTINSMSKKIDQKNCIQHYENIAMLIYHHWYINSNNQNMLPYNAKTMNGGKGLLFNNQDIPPVLQKILACYIITNTID